MSTLSKSPALMRACALACALALVCAMAASAQDLPPGIAADTPLEARIVTKVAKGAGGEAWTTENTVLTVLGKSVIVRIVGANVLIEAEFVLFYSKTKGYFLMAKSTAWIQNEKGSAEAVSTVKTLPAELAKKLSFYPLGTKGGSPNRQIEMEIVIAPAAVGAK